MDKPEEEKQKSLRERIALGECVSPLTADRCPVCVDCCEASHFKFMLNESLKDANVSRPSPDLLK